jgi:hypothetical protein
MNTDIKRLTPEELQEIRARCERVTPGPWRHWWCGDEICDCHAVEVPNCRSGLDKVGVRSTAHQGKIFVEDYCQILFLGDEGWSNAGCEAEFIAHARTDVPRLLDEIGLLTAELSALRDGSAVTPQDGEVSSGSPPLAPSPPCGTCNDEGPWTFTCKECGKYGDAF